MNQHSPLTLPQGAPRFIQPFISHEKALRFRIHGVSAPPQDGSHESQLSPLPFPRSYGERKEYIFSHTGHAAKAMDWHEWYCFNYAMNQGLDIGLPSDGSNRMLMMLSLIDHALSQPPRFVGMTQMPPLRADSTTAHSKQSMNLGQTMFERANLYHNGRLTQSLDALRREAMLGFWVHDMGECIFEIVTASDRFGLSPDEETWVATTKNEVESQVFRFACQLAAHCINAGKPERFCSIIHDIRTQVLAAQPIAHEGESLKMALLRTRMETMQTAMRAVETQEQLPTQNVEETNQLIEIYEKTEKSGSFLHNFVKTLESVEGQRYLQRNSAESPTDYWSRQMHNAEQYPARPGYDLSSDHDIVMSTRRAERRLPDLFALANTTAEKTLARETAAFTYGSIARQFSPQKGELSALAPAFIDRKPTAPENDHPLTLPELIDLRTKEMAKKQAAWEKQNPLDINDQFYTRERAGALYRAAETEVRQQRFQPNTACLLNMADTPHIPKALLARDMDSPASSRTPQNRRGR